MKAVLITLGVFVFIGAVYGLAFFGVIPAQRLADKSPALASIFIPMHLARHKAKPLAAVAKLAIDPAQQALESEKKQVAAEQAALDKERTAFTAQKALIATRPMPLPADSSAKIADIYATMSPDDIVRIFGKLPDPDVINVLTQLDEKKAGKILAALPVDRAARLTRSMSHPSPENVATAAAFPHPLASL